jgi:acetyltransferase-like isoleucine patch superfamily enzyme
MALGKFKVREASKGSVPRWKQYAYMVVGKPDFLSLLKYELITFLVGSLPGALGMALRSKLYPLLLGRVGKNVVFGRGITLRHPHKIFIGQDTIIDDNCMLDAKGEANQGITIGNGVFIGRNSIIYCKDGDIEIQDHADISFNCEVYSSHRVVIGRGTLVAAYCYIMSGGSYDYNSDVPFAMQDSYAKGPTIIGDGCWLGTKVVVSDGISIGAGTVVGAGVVVRQDIPASAMVTPHQRLAILPRDQALD